MRLRRLRGPLAEDELRRCSDTCEALSAAIDGEGSAADVEAAARHLGGCPQCRRFAAEVAAFTRVLRAARLERTWSTVEGAMWGYIKGGTDMQRRSFSRVALVGVGLAGVVAVSAATALAARSAASPFELISVDRIETACLPFCDPWDWDRHVGTFTSVAPFCDSGTVVLIPSPYLPDEDDWQDWRYTCTDGSGSLTITERGTGEGRGEWAIVEGSGGYAGLRGKGSWSAEQRSDEPDVAVIRVTMQGFADADTVAPSVAFTSASATKLRRPAGWYSIRLAFSLRDDVEGNTVTYRLRVTEGRGIAVDGKEGSTASGSVSTTFRILPSSRRIRSFRLLLTASDPVGNEVSLVRSLKLPR